MNADLIQRLEAASQGREEWRVQDPATGAYCISYSHLDTMTPERDCRRWLGQFKKDYPDHPHASFVVARVQSLSSTDTLIREAIAALKAQAAPPTAEPEAWGVYAKVDGQWVLQFPVRADRELAEADATKSRWTTGTELKVEPLGRVTQAAFPTPLTREEYTAIWQRLGGLDNFCKTFGFVQFGEAVEAAAQARMTPSPALAALRREVDALTEAVNERVTALRRAASEVTP